MTVQDEFSYFSRHASKLRELVRIDAAGSAEAAEMADELETLAMHADSPAVRRACNKALNEFRPFARTAHG